MLDYSTNTTDDLYRISCQLFKELWDGTPIRLLGIRTGKLVKPDAPVVYLNTFGEEGQKVFDALPVDPPLTLVAVSGLDWDRDMAPWGSPAVFKNAAPFSGGADDYLRLLTGEILPAAERRLAGAPRWRGIAGYSLAGLFAVYALCNTDAFSRAASVSGSLWFPGFREYVLSHTPLRQPDCVFFSLGDRESKTRNPVLRTVQENTEALCEFCRGQGIRTVFQLNPGGHHDHPAQRTAAGIQWITNG